MRAELLAMLGDYLETMHPRVFSEDAPDDASFPYVVFDLISDSSDGETQDIITVDIDGWDKPAGRDPSSLEALMAAIDGNGSLTNPTGLNKRTLTRGTLVATFYRETRLSLPDTDPRIRRRKYVYQARVFTKGVE